MLRSPGLSLTRHSSTTCPDHGVRRKRTAFCSGFANMSYTYILLFCVSQTSSNVLSLDRP